MSPEPSAPADRLRRGRVIALISAVVTGLAVIYTLALFAGMPDPAMADVARGFLHLGEVAAVVALALCSAAGHGPLARTGLAAAVVGGLVLAVAEVVVETAPGLGETLFGIGPILVGLGMVLVGVAVIRTGSLSGWRRYVPLALGVYVFAVMTPVLILSGGPPAAPALLALAGWDALWFLVAVSALAAAGAAYRGETAARIS